MAFFAGRLNGTPVLSLRNTTGGDINQHITPDNNTIFHSSMPYVYVEYSEDIGLGNAGSGYFVGGMSSTLQNILSNDPSRVVLAFLVYNYGGTEYRKQMHGRHETMSYCTVQGNVDNTSDIHSLFASGNFGDMCLEYGTFTRTTADWRDDICHRGSGGIVGKFNRSFGAYDPPSEALNHQRACGAAAMVPKNLRWRDETRFWNPLTNWNGYGDVIAGEQQFVVEPHIISPIGPRGRGHNCVFVRTVGGTLLQYANVALNSDFADGRFLDLGKPVNYRTQDGDGSYAVVQMRGDVTRYAEALGIPYTWTTYDITPVRMEYKVLNLRWSQTGGYSTTNMFTGSDIRISRTDFTIRGVNLRTTGTEMLLQAALGGVNTYANTFYATNAYINGIGDYPDNGSQALIGVASNGGTATIPPSSNGSSDWNVPRATLGTYKFPVNSSIEIDTRANAIRLNGKDLWSPNVRPLMLYSGNQNPNIIIGQNTNLLNIGNGGYALLNEYNIGLSGSGTSTIIMSMEYMGIGGTCPADVIIGIGASESLYYNGQALRVNREDYTVADGVNHQIINLPPGAWVPIHARRVNSFSDGPIAQKPRGNVVYFIRKDPSSGNIQFWVRSLSTINWVMAAKFRICIQKLA